MTAARVTRYLEHSRFRLEVIECKAFRHRFYRHMQACSTILANSDLSAETDQRTDTDKLSTACITFQELGQLTRSVCRSALAAMQHLVLPVLASMSALVILPNLADLPLRLPHSNEAGTDSYTCCA